MVQSPSNRLQEYWPPNRPPVERPLAVEQSPSARAWSDRLAICMGEHPILTLATAALVGLTLGWIVKRK
jgi:hypothetical protein